jgi:hypothetical protein
MIPKVGYCSNLAPSKRFPMTSFKGLNRPFFHLNFSRYFLQAVKHYHFKHIPISAV